MQSVASPVAAQPRRLTLWLALASVYILWGSTYLFIHFMIEQMPPLYMASMRFLAAGTLLYTYARVTGTPRPTLGQIRSAGAVGILLLGIANGCLTIAIQHIPTGMAALIAGTLPVFLLSLNWVSFGKTRPSNLALAGLLLGFVGVYFLIKPDKLQGGSADHNLIGAGLIMIGNLAWAMGTLMSPRLNLPSPFMSSGIQMLAGAAALLTVSLLTEPVNLFSIVDAPTKAIGSLWYLVIFGSIIGFSSYAWLARNAPPTLLSTYAYVNPVVAMLLGTLFAGEILTSQSLIGAGIVVAGVVLITLGRK
ncbi:EamA family transporter [Rudanella lutea]|uniref:EamA family transporter n=1 Tax=Rudanella lutea TaxID=451374 RepID=UPI00037889AF|nr:EamA family transporter [Rudanella lutea]